ncbi:hypothetical protein AKJ51_03440 [candidate division MSBL1 archaeon SCGC-AAA382A20]|uniref:Helix-turn-helix domain-containing protein n=1 Tax=candidate division MSBL1 archaeon SCGC-AAA382A20 TaxID=1698280 RepID=A0A133VJF4_9EURY|nr:hypothetical protein AKJ51_03440 [candidate division MSBL1 archaeon SCGC-AAA382A20]
MQQEKSCLEKMPEERKKSEAAPKGRTENKEPPKVLVQKEWADKHAILLMFDLPSRKFKKLVEDGSIRSVKWGEKRQSSRIYKVEDVENALQAKAEGKKVPRPGG